MHLPVLLHECLEGLNIQPGTTIVDATINGGGHSEAIIKKYGKTVHIIGIDLDADALARSKKRLEPLGGHIDFVCDSFAHIDSIVARLGVTNVAGVLFDLGLSSDQFDLSGRGFSFQKDEPLSMTFKKEPGETDVTARVIVNEWEESSIETILKGFGEERYAKRIARAIVEYRLHARIERTGELVAIIDAAVPASYRRGRLNPATRTFQALRIAVNGELVAVAAGLVAARSVLVPGGRLCAISFHSLEDRIVKRYFKSQVGTAGDSILTKKPITASEKEVTENPRSRSAKLRILQTHA